MLNSIHLAKVFCLCISCVVVCGNGCAERSKKSQACQAIILQERLPAGWRIIPNSEMPPSDKMTWWRQNPLLLQGAETKQLDVEGKPTSASKIWAAIYGKENREVLIFCLTYPTQDVAMAEYDLFAKSRPQDNGMLGYSREQENTIVLISLPSDCPDRDFFVKHFDAIAYQREATESAPTAR
jgi:hypothetical protein